MLSLYEWASLLLLALILWHAKLPKFALKAGSAARKLKRTFTNAESRLSDHSKDDVEKSKNNDEAAYPIKITVASQTPLASLPVGSAQTHTSLDSK